MCTTDGDLLNPYTAVDGVLAAITHTDCDHWRLSQQFIAAANTDVGPITTYAYGSTSCGAAWNGPEVCGTIYAGPVQRIKQPGELYDYPDNYFYCAFSTTASPYPNTDWGGQFPSLVSPDGTNWLGSGGWDSTPDPWCPTHEGAASYSSVYAGSTLSWKHEGPYVGWKSSRYSGAQPAGTPLPPDIQRSFKCIVTFQFGPQLERTVPAGTEASGEFAKPECPAMPADRVATSTYIYLESPGASPAETLIFEQDTTPAYQAWRNSFESPRVSWRV